MDELWLPTILDGEDKSSPFVNCLRNNYRHLRKWARRAMTDSFRLYERELTRYPLAIDFYAGRFCVHYFSTKRALEDPTAELQAEVAEALGKLFGTPADAIFWRTRAKNKGSRQYEKRGQSKQYFTVREYGAKFKVNLTDYLDTGLFLDHRETRQLVAARAAGGRLLNLFAYTCAFSVQAALAGALYTKSVDLSNTYTAWGRDNFTLNGLAEANHPIVRADCLKFLSDEIATAARYEVIIIDPPTISRSKKMEQLFDIQQDYVLLLTKALKLLADGGQLFFSTNSRKFNFDAAQFPGCYCREISAKVAPIDFHGAAAHRLWQLCWQACGRR
jgi:23S rRNA (cytosine1962-C5)-methyltransferase